VVLSDLENVTSPADRVAGYVAGKPGGTVGAALAPYPASRDRIRLPVSWVAVTAWVIAGMRWTP
jgi:hypothetical protein